MHAKENRRFGMSLVDSKDVTMDVTEDSEENDLDVSAGKLIIDLDFQSGEESGNNAEEKKGILNSNSLLHGSSVDNAPSSKNNSSVKRPYPVKEVSINSKNSPAKNISSVSKSNISPKSAKKSNPKDNAEKLKLKIKRRKMQTRTSGASHVVVNQCDNSSLAAAPSGAKNGELSPACASEIIPENSSVAQEKVEQKDATTWVRTISTSVNGDSLGPCEPGTHVSLEGIVWNETSGGVLVVNVTWKGKTYVGSLLDSSKYDWAPPRLCDSPNVDSEANNNNKGGTGKGRNGKRPVAKISHSASTSDLTRKSGGISGQKVKPKIPGGFSSVDSADEDSNSSGGAIVNAKGTYETILEPMSPVMTECPCRTCDKKFDDDLALKFHQNDSHRDFTSEPVTTESPIVQEETLNSVSEAPDSSDVKLSDVEAESLKQLFQVVGSPESGSKTQNTNVPLPTQPNGAKVKAIAAVAPRTATSDLPKLELSEDRAGSTSPAYSDISDDGAPVLEKEVEKSGSVKQESAESTIQVPPTTHSSTPKKPSAKLLPIASIPAADIRFVPKKEVAQAKTVDSGKLGSSSREVSCSPSTSRNVGANHITCNTGHPGTLGAVAVSNTLILPVSSMGLPGFAQMSQAHRMFPFDPTAQPFMTAGFLAGPNPVSGFGFGPIPSSLVVPSSLPPMGKPPGSSQHKINELANVEMVGSSKNLSSPSNSAHLRVPSSSKSSIAPGSLTTGRPISTAVECLKTSSTSARTTASPPVQRHMHTHHHTHNYPFLQAPFALIGSPQTSSMNGLPAGFHEK